MDAICSACGLSAGCRTPHIQPDMSGCEDTTCDVLLVGEAPGAEEDSQGIPFIGASGTLLRTLVKEIGLSAYNVAYTNVVRCRPPNNTTPSKKQIEYCAPTLLQEIDALNPKLVFLLGNTPLKAVLGETGITMWRGSKLEKNGRVYIPSFHPAYILRNMAELDTLAADLELGVELLAGVENTSPLEKYSLRSISTAGAVESMYKAVRHAKLAAFDTESEGLDMYGGHRLLMVSVAIDNPPTAWAVEVNDATRYGLGQMLHDPAISWLCHNAKYDIQVVKQGLGARPTVIGDCMLASYLMDVTPGRHGLKQLAGRYLQMYEYDQPLKDYQAAHPEADPSKPNGNMGLVPISLLSEYAAMDALATLELHKRLYAEMDLTQRNLYEQLLLPLSDVLTAIETAGVAIDSYILKRYITIYTKVRQTILAQVLEDEHVKRYIADQNRVIHLEWKNATKTQSKTARKKAQPKPFEFNLNSDNQVRELLYGRKYFGLKCLIKTEKGMPSVSWDALKTYAPTVPFIQNLHYYSLLGTMLGTFLEPTEGRIHDGRVRSSYSEIGTVSGRLASRQPNLQNIPTPEKEPDTLLAILPIKMIFTASDWGKPSKVDRAKFAEVLGPYVDKGGCLLAADYSGMELRIMASVADCKGMKDIFARGEDVHRIVSSRIFNVPVEEVTKEMRYKGKWTNWTLLYGGSEYTLYRLYGVPLEDGKHFFAAYYDLFPEIRQFQIKTVAQARRDGYAESPLGRKRYLPYINDRDEGRRKSAEREAMNLPIQSAAGDVLYMAMIVTAAQLEMAGLRAKMVNTVHDSVLFDVPLNELAATATIVKDVFENIKRIYAPAWFPGLNLDWLTCPLKVDLEIGSHYGATVEFHQNKEGIWTI